MLAERGSPTTLGRPDFQKGTGDRATFTVQVHGRAADQAAFQAQQTGYTGNLHANAGAGVPEVLYHCTTFENGLHILADGRINNSTGHSPPGVYTSNRPATYYGGGCVISVRPIAFVLSKNASTALDWTRPLTAGVVVRITRSVEEFVLDHWKSLC